MRPTAQLYRIGRAFGFPPCCAKHFCDRVDEGVAPPTVSGDGPWTGTGFIPCPDHAAKIRREGFQSTIDEINRDRDCPTPFPSTPDRDHEFVAGLLRETA